MRTVRTVAELRDALTDARRAESPRIGLVPTMGAFHDGHLALMRRARQECAVVVVSLFVNPTQFNEATDLHAYPRDERRDAALAADAGADLLFAPDPSEIYPDGFVTHVHVGGVSELLEGAERGPGHFDGVATVVAKLLLIAGPDVAYFGQKDYQQTLVVRRLVTDLNLPVRIAVCPTVREPDGLAMSSRNTRIPAADRPRAAALHRALDAADAAVAAGERDAGSVIDRASAELAADGIDPEYLVLASSDTLLPITRIEGPVIALVAARIGGVRLIDNKRLSTVTSPGVPVTAGSHHDTKGK